MRTLASSLFGVLCLTSAATTDATSINTARASADHVTVELVAEAGSLKPGARAWIGFLLKHDPHWHTYWVNPGDSGLPTRLEWHAPTGFKVGEPEWPAPTRIAYGDLFNFGYEDAVLLPIPVDVPADAQGGEAAMTVNARWLICNDVCIPGKATLSLRTLVEKTEPVKHASLAPLFAKARAARPVKAAAQGKVTQMGERITVELRNANLPQVELDAFPSSQKLFMNTPFKIARRGETITLTGERSEYFESAPRTLTLIVTRKAPASGSPLAWQFEIPWSAIQSKPPAQ